MASRRREAEPDVQEETQQDAGEAAMGRRDREKLSKLRRLVAAGHYLLATKGFDAATIAQITERADVGFGTFYNYFKSKEDLADAVMTQAMEDFAKASDALVAEYDDPALGVCLVQKALLERARTDPVWGWFVVRSRDASKAMFQSLHDVAGRHLARGVEQGRFRLESIELAERLTRCTLIEQMRAILESPKALDEDQLFCQMTLRMYGLSAEEAAAVSATPMPEHTKRKIEPAAPRSPGRRQAAR